MNQGSASIAQLVQAIRSDSAAARLSSLSSLRERFAEALGEGAADLEALIAQEADENIKLMRGARDSYYFCDASMTQAYAILLFRREENDPQKLIAETVRDESKSYPRPTPLTLFREPPFSLSDEAIARTLEAMEGAAEYADIRTSVASNGEAFLYSERYLGDAHADSLAEWIAVGIGENP